MEAHLQMKLTAEDVDLIAKAVLRMFREEGLTVPTERSASKPGALVGSETSAFQLSETGFLRLADVLKFIPVGKTYWYKGVKEGRFPKGIEIAPRILAYRAEDIKELIEKMGRGEPL